VGISDTTPEAQAIQERILRNVTGEQRLLLAWDMSLFGRELARAGIGKDHPDWSEAQVAREVLRLAFLPAPLPAGFAMSPVDVFRRLIAAFFRQALLTCYRDRLRVLITALRVPHKISTSSSRPLLRSWKLGGKDCHKTSTTWTSLLSMGGTQAAISVQRHRSHDWVENRPHLS